MKKKWFYNYKKGLRKPLVSSEIMKKDEHLYFVLSYETGGFYESLLIKLDIKTLESEILFKVDHVMRSFGVFENDQFYFTTFEGMAYCVDIWGKLIWQTDIGGRNADDHVLMDDNRLYMSDDGLYCLNKENGQILWVNKDTECKTNCTFATDEKCVYHGDLGGKIRCVDKITGKTLWSYGENLWISQCILLDENCLMACHIHGSFLFLNAKTGELIKEVRAEEGLYRKPLFYNGKIYIGDSTQGNMTCYDFCDNYDLEKVFTVHTGGEIATNAVIDDKYLYFASENGYLYCVDNETGKEISKPKKTSGTCRDILINNNEIIALTDKGQIECFER